jgi:hypothetical protein
MKYAKVILPVFMIILFSVLIIGCSAAPIAAEGGNTSVIAPTVNSTIPGNLVIGVATNVNINAIFSKGMDSLTITDTTFTLKQGLTLVGGTVTYIGNVATLNPTVNLSASTVYTATITTNVKDIAGHAMVGNKTWSFTTGTGPTVSPAAVNLGSSGSYVILGKSGISTVPSSTITGDIAISPAAASFITGFSLIMDGSNQFSTTGQVSGRVYAADYSAPTPSNLTVAIGDMQTAYTDAAGRLLPDFTELGSGNISGLTLVPGLYKWGTGVLIATDVTIKGGSSDVWIFQISGDLTINSAVKVILTGGAQAKNIYWQVFGVTALNTTAHLEGIVLCKTAITLAAGATVKGRLMSQTAVTLDSSIVTSP